MWEILGSSLGLIAILGFLWVAGHEHEWDLEDEKYEEQKWLEENPQYKDMF